MLVDRLLRPRDDIVPPEKLIEIQTFAEFCDIAVSCVLCVSAALDASATEQTEPSLS